MAGGGLVIQEPLSVRGDRCARRIESRIDKSMVEKRWIRKESDPGQRNLRSEVSRYSRNIEKAFVRAATSHSLKTTSGNRSWASNSAKARMTLGMWSGGISRRNKVLQLSQRVLSCITRSGKSQWKLGLIGHLR